MNSVPLTDETVALFGAVLADGTRVTFAHGWCDESAVAAALDEARANPGRVVELLAATHPQKGGAVRARLRFGLVPDEDPSLPGRVRAAGEGGLTGPSSHTLAPQGTPDTAVAAMLAMRLLRTAYRGHDGTGLCLFRPLPAEVDFPDRRGTPPTTP